MKKSDATILVVDDDPGVSTQYRWLLSQYKVVSAVSRADALKQFERERPQVAIVDLGLPPDPDGATEGLAVVEGLLRLSPHAKIIVVTGNENKDYAVRAIALGAYDFLRKPVEPEALTLIADRAVRLYDLEQENRRLLAIAPHASVGGIIGDSPQMRAVMQDVERVADTDAAILLLGDSGTGKELLANALHKLSGRADRAFIAINCAAIPENLLESELFGHEKGAFTGAIKQTIGKIECANGGTLFLDEVGDIPLPMQVKLLRFLEERVIERVGGRQKIAIDTRVISATHQDLPKLIAEGRFREDLYYRINEISIRVPALREREGDVLLLAKFFLNVYGAQFKRPLKGFAGDAVAAIHNHPWRGNVRELENRVKRAVIMTKAGLVSAADLDLAAPEAHAPVTLKEARRRAEREAISIAMAHANNNISRMASLLGVSRPTLYDVLAQHGIDARMHGKPEDAGSETGD